MGTTLTGTTPQDTYDSLIKVTDNGPIGATAKLLTDGLGNDSVLYLGTAGLGIKSTSVLSFNINDATHSIGYDSVIDGSQLRGQNGIRFSTGSGGGSERMRIKSGGSIDFSATDALTEYNFGYNRPTASNLLVNGTNNNKIRIQNSESDIVVLNSNGNSYFNGGNVGIGTSAPSGKLHVSSTGDVEVKVNSSAGAYTSKLTLNAAGGGASVIDANGGTQPRLMFQNNGTTIASITNGGLCFNSDTAAANALDDYEEGTFTPTLTASTSDPTVTYATGNTGGIYTKVGNKVTVSFEVRWTALSGGSGEVRISGLPFTRRTTTLPDGERTIIDSYNNTITGKYLTGTVGSNTSYVGVLNVNSAAAIAPMYVADLPTAILGLLRGTITYFV